MNEDNLQKIVNPQTPPTTIPSTTPANPSPTVEHPLHMLDNQADPETKPKVILQKSIRTYESDVADVLANKKTSVMTMATAESERRNRMATKIVTKVSTNVTQGVYSETNPTINLEESPEPSEYVTTDTNTSKKLLMVIISIVLIIFGIGGGYFLYLKSPLAIVPPNSNQNSIPSVISPDSQKIIALNSATEGQLIKIINSSIQNQKVNEGAISEFILTQMTGSSTLRVSGIDFLNKLNSKIPDILSRSLTNQWMIGAYETNDQNLPFIILKTDFFQNAFSGMLKWESTMPDEFADIFNYKNKNYQEENANSSSTIASFFSIRGKFEDRTISNRDVREFINDNGELLLLYSFIDKDTIIITTSEITLKSLIEKIDKQTYMRYN